MYELRYYHANDDIIRDTPCPDLFHDVLAPGDYFDTVEDAIGEAEAIWKSEYECNWDDEPEGKVSWEVDARPNGMRRWWGTIDGNDSSLTFAIYEIEG